MLYGIRKGGVYLQYAIQNIYARKKHILSYIEIRSAVSTISTIQKLGIIVKIDNDNISIIS